MTASALRKEPKDETMLQGLGEVASVRARCASERRGLMVEVRHDTGRRPKNRAKKTTGETFFFALSARAVVLFSCLCACALPSASGLFCAAVLVPPCSLLLEFWRDVATCAPSQRADSREERIAKGHTFVLTVHSDASFVSHKGTSAWREEPKTESMFQGKGSRIAPSLF